ncbi:MAG: DUF4845 domain-containing protein [Gammaproteobacteria bacterium]|nr:DUF4845 domain-containing protein [Gammaproteobacteria bacterium]
MKTLKRQRGMTGLGWLTVLALILFFSLMGIKLAPIYMEHYSVKSVLMSLKDEPLITSRSTQEIRKMIKRRLKVNGVYQMDNDAIKITRTGGVTTVDITYEVQKNVVGNVDLLVFFSDNVSLVAN